MKRSLLSSIAGRLGVLLAPPTPWRRYRVTPRANPAVFRRQLFQSIRARLKSLPTHGLRLGPRPIALEDSSNA